MVPISLSGQSSLLHIGISDVRIQKSVTIATCVIAEYNYQGHNLVLKQFFIKGSND